LETETFLNSIAEPQHFYSAAAPGKIVDDVEAAPAPSNVLKMSSCFSLFFKTYKLL
jgi:hypothetical protein